MWRYQQPDFALFLLGELQKQQQGSMFCDTLLQTEGVCIPAHSCVLAALSPVLSRALSTCPTPPAGQSRLLSLQAVGSRALLKLVGFLYSGEMEVESRREHEEVMASAHRLGLRNLIEKKRVWVERVSDDVERSWRDTGVQTENGVNGKKNEDMPLPLEKQRIGNSSNALVRSGRTCGLLEPDFTSVMSLDKGSPNRCYNVVPSTTDMTEASKSCRHKTKAKKRWKMAKRKGRFKKHTWQKGDGTESDRVGLMERGKNVSGKDFRKLVEAIRLQKSATTEQEETQIKLKIKLRRMKGACWEIASVQGESVTNEPKECGSPAQNCPSCLLPAQNLGTLTPPTDLPVSPSDSSTRGSSNKHHTPNRISASSPLDMPTLSSSPPHADESDEHIAMLLEDMVLMGLNILPLVPLDRNLDEHPVNQLGPLQGQKDGQKGSSTQGACRFVQDCEPVMRKGDVSKRATPVGSPGQRDKELKDSGFQYQMKSNTVELLAQTPRQEMCASTSHSDKVKNVERMAKESVPSPVKALDLNPKATPFPDCSFHVNVSVSDDMPDFKFLKCLSPLESEKTDSDVPTQELSRPSQHGVSEAHGQHPEAQNLPPWLSDTPLILEFPLNFMIDSSQPHPTLDFKGRQNQSYPDLAEMQKLKVVSGSDMVQGDNNNNASELPGQRMTRRRRLATQKPKVKVDTEPETSLKNSLSISMTLCGDVSKVSTSNSCGASTQITTTYKTNKNTITGVKRKQENSLPLTNKMALLNTSKQSDCEDVAKGQVTQGPVKRGRGRPPKRKGRAAVVQQKFTNCSTSTSSDHNGCEVEESNMANEMEQDKTQEPNEEEDSNKMVEANFKCNFEPTKQNAPLKYAGWAKRPSIIDQIFHQTCPSTGSTACVSSLQTGQQLSSSPEDTSQRFNDLLGRSEVETSKLVTNSSEQCDKDICGENNTKTQLPVNYTEEIEEFDNQVSLELSHKDNEQRDRFVVHVMSPTKTGRVITNEPTIQDNIEMVKTAQEMDTNLYINPDGTQAEYLRDKQSLEAPVCKIPTKGLNEISVEMTSDNKEFQTVDNINTQVIHLVGDVTENEKTEGDLGRHQVVQTLKDTREGEETVGQRANDEAAEYNVLPASDNKLWETTNGWDNDDIDVEGSQSSPEMTDGQAPLEEDELSRRHIASPWIADDSSSAALAQADTQERLSRDTPVQTDESSNPPHSDIPSDSSEVVSAVLSTGTNSMSEDPCHSDEEEIEVDVLEDSPEVPLWSWADRRVVTLPSKELQDPEDHEMDVTEEEEVDVTGEEDVDITGEETE